MTISFLPGVVWDSTPRKLVHSQTSLRRQIFYYICLRLVFCILFYPTGLLYLRKIWIFTFGVTSDTIYASIVPLNSYLEELTFIIKLLLTPKNKVQMGF